MSSCESTGRTRSGRMWRSAALSLSGGTSSGDPGVSCASGRRCAISDTRAQVICLPVTCQRIRDVRVHATAPPAPRHAPAPPGSGVRVGAGPGARAEGARCAAFRRCSACPCACRCAFKKRAYRLSALLPKENSTLSISVRPSATLCFACLPRAGSKRRGPGRGRRTQPEPRRVCAENTNAPSSSSTARVFVVICGTPSSAAAVERVALCRSRFISGYDWRAGITHSLVRGERELPSAVASALTSIIHRPFSG